MVHDKDKLNIITARLSNYNIKYSIFKAIDGTHTPYREQYEAYKSRPFGYEGCHELEFSLNKKVLSSYGSYGILKTMEQVFEDAQMHEYKNILTLQDDIILCKDFNNKFDKSVSHVPLNWKIISLGVSQHIWRDVEFIPNINYYLSPHRTDGAFATAFDHSIYNDVLNKIRKFNCNFDSGPLRDMYKKYPGSCYTLYPNLIIAQLDKSATQESRDMKKYSEKFKWNLNEYDL